MFLGIVTKHYFFLPQGFFFLGSRFFFLRQGKKYCRFIKYNFLGIRNRFCGRMGMGKSFISISTRLFKVTYSVLLAHVILLQLVFLKKFEDIFKK